jgi:integrase
LDDARRLKAARTTAVATGEYQERSRDTLHAYSREWVKRYQGRGRRGFRENTRDEYTRTLEQYVFNYFPERTRLTAIQPTHVAKFVGWLCNPEAQGRRLAEDRRAAKALKLKVSAASLPLTADGKPPAPVALSDSTVRNIMAPLSACLATVREGVIRSHPAREVDLPHRPTAEESEDEEVRAMTRDQLAVLLAQIPGRHRLFFRLLAATGLRISEAVALQWRHLQLDGSRPHVKVRRALVRGRMGPPKSRYGRREVPMGADLVDALREHRKATGGGELDLVFTAANGAPINSGNLRRRVLKPAAEEACVEWVGFHAFRHTCASLLFADGRNAKQVQVWLGHHSAAFTLATYVHLLDGDIGEPLSLPRASDSAPGVVVATQRNDGPDRLHDPEGPGAREEPIDARQGAPNGEREDEARAATLKRVHEHHEREDDNSEGGQHASSLALAGGNTVTTDPPGNDDTTPEGDLAPSPETLAVTA